MKKFLSILLALAVGFTFTFGSAMSAFGATLDDTQKATDYAKTAIDSQLSLIALKDTTHSASAVTYAKEQTAKIATNNVVNDLITVLDAESAGFTLDAFKTELNKWVGGTATTYIGKTTAGTNNYNFAYAKDSLNALYTSYAEAKEYDARIADANAVLDGIKIDTYSTKFYKTINENSVDVDYTYRTYAQKLVDDAKDAVKGVKPATTLKLNTADVYPTEIATDAADYKAVLNALLYGYEYKVTGASKTYITTSYDALTKVKNLPKKDAAPNGGTAGAVAGVIGKLSTLLTVEDEAADDAKDAVNLEHAKANFAYFAKNTYFETVKAVEGEGVTLNAYYDSTTKKVADVAVVDVKEITKAEAAAINAAIMEKITTTIDVVNVALDESADPVADVTTYCVTNTFKANVIDKALNAVKVYNAVEATAAQMKAAVSLDGSKAYDDAAIDAALAKDKTDIYSNFDTVSFKAKNYLGQVPYANDPVDTAISAATAKFKDAPVLSGKDQTAEADKKYCKSIYAAGDAQKEYEVIKAETKAKLNDAKTVDEVNSIMAEADKALAELKTALQDTTALNTSITNYKAALLTYATEQCKLLNKNNTSDVKTYRPLSFLDDTDNNGILSAYEDGCEILEAVNDASKLEAAYAKAKALFANIKTDAELKAEADKVTALVGALPASPLADLSNEAQFVEAKTAYEAYLDMYGAEASDVTGSAIFEKKLETLKAYQIAAVKKAIDDLSKLTAGSDAYNAATKAAREQLEKYLEMYDVNSATFDGTKDAYNDGDTFNITAEYKTKLVNAEEIASNAAINAVRAMISKLTENSSAADIKAAREAFDALSGSQQRALGEGYAYKLAEAEKLVGVSDADAKAYVQDLAIAVRTAKVGKKVKVTVNADVQKLVDNGFTVEYKFYKSTKKGSGYKNTVNKTTNTYTNTNPVKGKNYYKVKLVVKNADGTVVATTPLTQCKYGVRTIK